MRPWTKIYKPRIYIQDKFLNKKLTTKYQKKNLNEKQFLLNEKKIKTKKQNKQKTVAYTDHRQLRHSNSTLPIGTK